MGLCQGLWALYSQTTRFTIAIWNPQQQHFPQAMDCAKGRTVVYPGAQQALDLVICPYNWVGEMTPKILKCQKNGYAVWMCVCVRGTPQPYSQYWSHFCWACLLSFGRRKTRMNHLGSYALYEQKFKVK